MLGRCLLVIVPLLGSVSAQQPEKPAFVPLTQIAARGEELNRTLRDLARQLPADSELTEFDKKLAQQEENVRLRLEESRKSLSESATILELREQARRWRAYGSPEARQRKTLEAWGAACERAAGVLTQHQAVWRAT